MAAEHLLVAMNLQLLSDLHLEVHPHFQPTPAADAQVLVLDKLLTPMGLSCSD